ncbi:MAG TPA: SUF system NifU family Fe-S cluster assembly protein [Candidatus Omnitrophota bacterium]|nr:SUF system NifU family Fe-S cluster assembly protein [Candidatus Omnitrophota bacterium]HPS36843.1 SUF system NifU family Fe-S cluster assembly protein [Candidatus Omnitrophota bacterium]
MSDDIRELYQQMIMDHNKNPRNFHALPDADRTAEGYNPLCGDHFKVFVKMEGDMIRDIAFEGAGCAISKASASMMTAALKGKTRQEAKVLFDEVRKMLSRQAGGPFDETKVGKLATLAGVCEFPARVKCASLAWHTMTEALDPTGKQVTTE